jgi:hypothetical protein
MRRRCSDSGTATRLSGWRKLAGSSWSAPTDPQFYGDLDVDAAALLDYVNEVRRRTNVHVTVTHVVVKALAHALAAVPELNVRLAHGREHPRNGVDVLVIVAVGADDLTGVKIVDADRKSVAEIAAELERRTAAIRGGKDPEFGATKALLSGLPPRVLRLGLRLSAWLTSDLNLDLSRFGLPRQAFGSAMVSSIGMTGVSHAYSPLASYYRVPVLLLVGAVEERPVAVSGHVLARPRLTVTATFDHRYTDGLRAARFSTAIREFLVAPQSHDHLATREPVEPTGTVDLSPPAQRQPAGSTLSAT